MKLILHKTCQLTQTHFYNCTGLNFCQVVIRRTEFDLRKARERAHILEGLIIASYNIDEVIRIIRAAKTPNDAL